MGLPGQDPACAFCAIVAGRARASRVYEDAQVLAFLDIRPAAPGDLPVIPKAHATSLEDIDGSAYHFDLDRPPHPHMLSASLERDGGCDRRYLRRHTFHADQLRLPRDQR